MLRVNALTVIPDSQPKLPFVIPDFHFDPLRLGMLEGIAQCFPCDPVDFVSEDRMEILRSSFDIHVKLGSIWVRFAGREFLTQSVYRQRKVTGHDRGRAQALYGIPALRDRFSGLIDSALQCFPGFGRTLRQKISRCLKTQQESLETLQQSIVQFPRDACALADALFQTHVELLRDLTE